MAMVFAVVFEQEKRKTRMNKKAKGPDCLSGHVFVRCKTRARSQGGGGKGRERIV